MKKVFLYLYPIKEYSDFFTFTDDYYKSINQEKPFPILNECINKRYREQGYQIVYALYPDKEIYGIDLTPTDKIIYTDIRFKEASGYHKDGSQKTNKELKYPNEEFLILQLGDIDEIVIGGYHCSDHVKKVAEHCYNQGIKTLVDLDLTDLFFSIYSQKDYFDLERYNPEKFKKYIIKECENVFLELNERERLFNQNYESPVYGFSQKDNKSNKKK